MAYTKAQLKKLVIDTARRYGIDVNIALAQINQESGFNPNAGSSAGARGIAQFMPATARRFGVNVNDPVSSMEGWGKYMTYLLRRYNGDYKKALAGYNAGEGNVDKYGGVPPFAETRHYVKTILANAGKTISDVFSGGDYQLASVSADGQFSSVFGEPFQGKIIPISPETKKGIILAIAALIILYAVVNIWL